MLRHSSRLGFIGSLLLGSFLFAACGAAASDPVEDDTVGPAASAAFTTWRADHLRAGCERKLRCTTPAPFPSVDDCVAAADADIQAATPRIADSIEVGNTKFFADAAAACLAIYETSCSTTTTDILIACNKAYDGQLELGESCVGNFECGGPSGVNGYMCWEGCTPLYGYEDVLGHGTCVQGRPPECPHVR